MAALVRSGSSESITIAVGGASDPDLSSEDVIQAPPSVGKAPALTGDETVTATSGGNQTSDNDSILANLPKRVTLTPSGDETVTIIHELVAGALNRGSEGDRMVAVAPLVMARRGSLEDANISSHHRKQLQDLTFSLITLPVLESSDLQAGGFLGKGGFGDVYKATHKTQACAIKILKFDPKNIRDMIHKMGLFTHEALMLHRINSSRCMQFWGLSLFPDRSCLVTELLPGGDLAKYFREHPERFDRLERALEMVEGVAYLHSNDIAHCDLKGVNVMIDSNGESKLIDLGGSYFEGSAYTRKECTPRYAAPEVLMGSQPNRESDVFSMGCILYEAFTGRRIGLRDNPMNPPATFDDTIPEDLQELLYSCWSPDPQDRQTSLYVLLAFQTILDRLQGLHPDALEHIETLTAEELVTPEGEKLLHVAIQLGLEQAAIALVVKGTNVNTSYQGLTPLHRASMMGSMGVVGVLLGKQADPNALDPDQNTPLHFACRQGHEGVASLLLDVGARETVNSHRKTPLFDACGYGREGVVALLLGHASYQANLDIESGDKTTPLCLAAARGFFGIVKMLVEAGANPNSKRDDGAIPYTCASAKGHGDIVEFLLEHGALTAVLAEENEEVLLRASQEGKADIVRLLLSKKEYGFDVNRVGSEGFTCTHLAAREGIAETLQVLLEHNPILNFPGKTSPLHYAARRGHADCVTLLLGQEGIEVGALDEYGDTPLQDAARGGHRECVEAILRDRRTIIPEAVEYFERILPIQVDKCGASSPLIAETYHYLGLCCQTLGNQEKGAEYFERASIILKGIYGEKGKQSDDKWKSSWIEPDKEEKIVGDYEEVLTAYKQMYGRKHVKIAETTDRLAEAWKAIGNVEIAIAFYEKSLDMRRSLFGKEHPDIATSLHNLGEACATNFRNQGDAWAAPREYRKEIVYYEQSLEMRRSLFGKEHSSIAMSLNNLGEAWAVIGEPYRAFAYHRESLKMRRSLFGKEHSSIAMSLNNLGEVWAVLRQPQKAIAHHEESLEMRQHLFGKNHPDIAASLHNLGNGWVALEEPQKAIAFYEQSLEMRRSLFGKTHPDIVMSLNNLGDAWDSLREYQKAITCHEEILEIKRLLFGKNHPDIAASLYKLGFLWVGLRKERKAIALFYQCLEMRRFLFEKEHPSIEECLNSLVILWSSLKNTKAHIYLQAWMFDKNDLLITRAIFESDEFNPEILALKNANGETLLDIAVANENAEAIALLTPYQAA